MSKCAVWKKCYYGGNADCSCHYSAITGHSRIARNGKRNPDGEIIDGVCNYYAKRIKTGATSRELTQELIRNERLKYHSKQDYKATWTDKKQRMLQRYQEGTHDVDTLRKELHLSSTKAYQMANELGLRLTRNYDSRHDKMKRMWMDGASDREIAAEFEITVRTVQKWRHDNNMPPNLKQGEWGQKL